MGQGKKVRSGGANWVAIMDQMVVPGRLCDEENV